MGCDLVVALGRATGTRKTIFGLNNHLLSQQQFTFVVCPGKEHVHDEMIHTEHWQLSQCKQSLATLGCQPENCWGYLYGVNEKRVAVGFSTWESRLPTSRPSMAATDLVRLLLERSSSARQATDLLTDLISRHGQRNGAGFENGETDHVFLVTDNQEAFVVEAADRFWTLQEISSARAVSDVGLIRQDWNRISPGLADFVIDQEWWQADGSKLDFAGSLSVEPAGLSSALRRWGRATLLLENQSGHIDLAFLRRLFSDHYEDTRYEVDPIANLPGPTPLCRHAADTRDLGTAGSFLVELDGEQEAVIIAWCAFGPPCTNVYFPVVLIDGSHPVSLSAGETPYCSKRMKQLKRQLQLFVGKDAECWQMVRERFADLQSRFEDETEMFVSDAAELCRDDRWQELQSLSGAFMQNHLERYESCVQELLGPAHLTTGGVAVG